MKPSKQHPGAAGGEITQPGDGVTVAARIFSNYVLVPTAGHPDKGAAQAMLHGAALLVFADESHKQIQLRTGEGAHITREVTACPELRAAVKLVDKVESGHRNSEQQAVNSGQLKAEAEKNQMTTAACSACHTLLDPGATVCPGCGLPLVAQAVPVVRRQAPIWPWILGAILLFIVVCSIADSYDKQKKQDTATALLSDLQTGKLNTPEAFQARCGQAHWTQQTKDGTELHYLIGASVPRFQSEQTDWSGKKPKSYRINLDPSMALVDLSCK